MSSKPKCRNRSALIVIYNHNYESNVDKVNRLYGDRFSIVLHLMPFYYGNKPTIVPVHGSSFFFQSFIAQARRQLLALDCDRFLFIGDDLLLNPCINESNVSAQLNLLENDLYIDGFVNVNSGQNNRAVFECHRFSTRQPGLSHQVSDSLPTFDAAFDRLRQKGLIDRRTVNSYKPYYPQWQSPIASHVYKNYKVFKGRVYNALMALNYQLFPRAMSYPCVFGYSDLFSIPKNRLTELCHFFEVFSSWRMFVELAIPTTLLLMGDRVVTMEDIPFKAGNVWFPQTPEHHERMNHVIRAMYESAELRIEKLSRAFPREYLYLHPVKLSGHS